MKEDLKAVPDEMRAARRDTDRRLADIEEEHPIVREALDWRLVLAAAAIALVVAFVARLVGLGFALSLGLFVVLFAGGWFVLSRRAAPRRRTDAART